MNAQCTISGLTFNNCKGLPGDVDTGGAIAVDNFSSGGGANVTTINDCAFTNNQSGWGGAVDVFNGGLAMSRCTFTGNTCTGLAFGTNGGGGAAFAPPAEFASNYNVTAPIRTPAKPDYRRISPFVTSPGTSSICTWLMVWKRALS